NPIKTHNSIPDSPTTLLFFFKFILLSDREVVGSNPTPLFFVFHYLFNVLVKARGVEFQMPHSFSISLILSF
ncbi:hypothetical protein, partial [Acinetobacter baumannii]|uniref:hypothetical protein n=1 Tax=Acinetobacter baumannii TaxID=470 RepID=UPI003399DA9C